FPLFRYGADTINRTPWGFYWAPQGMDWFVLPEAMRYLPVVVLLGIARATFAWGLGAPPEALRRRVCLATIAAAMLAAVGYHPDYYHLAYAAPVMLPILADGLEATLALAERRAGLPRLAGTLVALGFLVALGRLLDQNLATRRRLYPYAADTAIGRID